MFLSFTFKPVQRAIVIAFWSDYDLCVPFGWRPGIERYSLDQLFVLCISSKLVINIQMYYLYCRLVKVFSSSSSCLAYWTCLWALRWLARACSLNKNSTTAAQCTSWWISYGECRNTGMHLREFETRITNFSNDGLRCLYFTLFNLV